MGLVLIQRDHRDNSHLLGMCAYIETMVICDPGKGSYQNPRMWILVSLTASRTLRNAFPSRISTQSTVLATAVQTD